MVQSDRQGLAGSELQQAWAKVQSNAGGCGVDGITVARFAKDSPRGLLDLKRATAHGELPALP